ncbi:hypothetical protein EC988_001332 [Linderina pennispora]|nr:hypothetical protein EC988_001332 [Linderina pennispora]
MMPGSEHLTFSVHDEYDTWSRISSEFTSRLPLRNLIWKGGLSQSSRFVEQLNIKVATNEATDRDTLPISALQTSPLLNIYLAESTDSEADTYKSITKPRVKNWVDKVSQRKGEEWLVVYLPNDSEGTRMATAKFLNMRTSVLDKLKGDFQSKKDVERVVALHPSLIESWNAVFLVIRERVVQALEGRVAALAEEIRRMDANRMLPGWNYCKFFVLKEGLVRLYRLMGLNEEALAQYDELEAAFFQLLESQSLSWFTKFGGGEPGDDFTDILDAGRKPYRKQMVENTISMFDFRIYLFGRQSELLIALERYTEFIERAERFVPTFAKAMRAPGTGLSLAFVASWTYSTCQNIVEVCEGVLVAQSPHAHGRANTNNTNRLLSAAKAEFLTSARRQLDILGTLHDRLPPSYLRKASTYTYIPTKLLETPDASDSEDEKGRIAELQRARKRSSSAAERYREFVGSVQITNPVLTEALASDNRFDQIYIRTCEQATQYYNECARKRFAQVLQGDIAQLHICRGRWLEATKVLRPLIAKQTNSSLGIMDVHLVERLAVCERNLGNHEKCLGYLLSLLVHSRFLDAETQALYAEQLVEMSEMLQREHRIDAASVFQLSSAETVDLDESLGIVVELTSAIPRCMQAASVRVVLANTGSGQLEIDMDVQDTPIESGSNRIQLTTDSVSCPGQFAVRLVEISIGKIVFYCAPPSAHFVVRLNEHPANAFVAIEPAASVQSDGPSCMRIAVESRGHKIDGGLEIRVFSSQGAPLLDPQCTVTSNSSGSGSPDWAIAGGAIVLADGLEPNRTVSVEVELSDQYATDHITVYASYRSDSQPRLFLNSELVELALPVSVSAHFSALSTKSIVQVRMQCLSLGPVRPLPRTATAVRGFLQLGDFATDVYEFGQTVSQIDLDAEVAFVPLFSVVHQAVDACVRQATCEHGLAQHSLYISRLVMAHMRSTLDVDATLRSSQLVFEPLGSLWVVASADATGALRASMRRMCNSLQHQLESTPLLLDSTDESVVRRVRQKFSQAAVRKFAVVSMSFDGPKHCSVYEPVPITVRVEMPDDQLVLLRVVLTVDEEQWLVAGAVTQDVAVEDKAAVLRYVLVPLQVGYLQPPSVVCLANDREGANYRPVHTWTSYGQASPCVLANDKVPSVYTVPILV